MEVTGISRLVEALEAEREARRRAEQEIDRLRSGSVDGERALQRSRFLGSMGHTLRTPLNAILGFSEVLQDEHCGSLTEHQRSLLGKITAAGQRQLALINNLMDLARIHAGDVALEPQSVAAAQLAQDVVAEHVTRAQKRGVELSATAHNPGMVPCDPAQLRQALANLVDNAIRFTDPGGVVQITVSKRNGVSDTPDAEDESDNVVRIEVADTGAGVPLDDQPLLFDDFEHAESLTSRRERRAGVGLALTRRIIELHAGRIWVESSGKKGEGSRFFVELPAEPIRSAA